MDRIRKEMERGAGYEHTAYKNHLDTWNDNDVRNELRMRRRRPEDDRYREKYYTDDNYNDYRDDRRYRNENRYMTDRRDYEPSYVSSIKNYHPPGGRRIEASQIRDDEMQEYRRYPRNRDYSYQREAAHYNRDDDYRWSRGEDNRGRYQDDLDIPDRFRGRRRYARGDFDSYY